VCNLEHFVAHVHRLVLVVVAGLRMAGVDCLLLALELIVDHHSAGLGILGLVLVVHHLFRLFVHSPHHVHAALTGLEVAGQVQEERKDVNEAVNNVGLQCRVRVDGGLPDVDQEVLRPDGQQQHNVE